MGGGGCGRRDDSLSSANCRIHRRPVLRDEMKGKRAIVVTVTAVLVVLAVASLWSPSSAPAGQEPLLALSSTNFSEFEETFDGDTSAPRLVLLLSPTCPFCLR